MGFKAAALKQGPRAFKSVSHAKYGDPETGELKKTALRFAKYAQGPEGGFEFDCPEETFNLENEEISLLAAFLTSPEIGAGCYEVVEGGSEVSALIDRIESSGLEPDHIARLLTAVGTPEALSEALLAAETGVSAAEMAVLSARRQKLATIRELCESATATETAMQAEIGSVYWLFGGRYAGVLPRRNLALLDEVDIPLVRTDGTIQVVELKGPVIPDLVVRHRNHLIVGKHVHEAVAQAMNYLRSLDEQGPQVERALRDIGIGIGTRRAFATVVIGHPAHVTGGFDEQSVEETVRTYNSHLSRIEVVTYASLLNAAERSMSFVAETD